MRLAIVLELTFSPYFKMQARGCIKRIYPHKNSQAVKKWCNAFISLGEKSCEIKSGGQEIAAMMLTKINPVPKTPYSCIYSCKISVHPSEAELTATKSSGIPECSHV